jgi:hypothetical protein
LGRVVREAIVVLMDGAGIDASVIAQRLRDGQPVPDGAVPAAKFAVPAAATG